VGPRLRVVYLLAVAVGLFFLHRPLWVGLAVVSQAVAWLAVGLPPRRLARQVFKFWGFALLVIASYALTADDPAVDRWHHVAIAGHDLALNVAGALTGAMMILRVIGVVLASQVARAGDSRAIAAGLGKLGLPALGAVSIDAVLALMGTADGAEPGLRGGGGGGGGGRGMPPAGDGRGEPPPETFWQGLKRLARGDVSPLIARLERQMARAERLVADRAGASGLDVQGARGRALVKDVAAIAGVALTMLGIKALKVLPSIPFAPGHKLVLLTPLYIVASVLTRSRLGATWTGLTMGTVAFVMGDGRYGIYEILKHVVPGLIADATVPVLTRGGRTSRPWVWTLLGGLIGLGRFATIFGITLTVQAPAVAYAVLVPGMTVHGVFGMLSGYVTYHFVTGVERLRGPHEPLAPPEE
jgi:hypothetical protein